MKAIITRGKHKGEAYEVSQWCNDWFTLDSGNWEIDRQPFNPSSLQFNYVGAKSISDHKNNGILFALYELVPKKALFDSMGLAYVWGFKRRSRRPAPVSVGPNDKEVA